MAEVTDERKAEIRERATSTKNVWPARQTSPWWHREAKALCDIILELLGEETTDAQH